MALLCSYNALSHWQVAKNLWGAADSDKMPMASFCPCTDSGSPGCWSHRGRCSLVCLRGQDALRSTPTLSRNSQSSESPEEGVHRPTYVLFFQESKGVEWLEDNWGHRRHCGMLVWGLISFTLLQKSPEYGCAGFFSCLALARFGGGIPTEDWCQTCLPLPQPHLWWFIEIIWTQELMEVGC